MIYQSLRYVDLFDIRQGFCYIVKTLGVDLLGV